MNLQPILHGLVWTLYLEVAAAWADQDAAHPRETHEVFNGSVFMHCQNFDDYDRAFAVMRQQRLLVEKAEQPDPEFVSYDLVLNALTLRKHLAISGVLAATDPNELIGCFLTLSSNLGRYPPTLADHPTPVVRESAPIPPAFAEAVQSFNDAGYCLVSDGRMSWLPKISRVMEAEGLWVGGTPADALRREWLATVWDTMPDDLKWSAKDQYGCVNPLSLFAIMKRHWDPQFGWGDYGTGPRAHCGFDISVELAKTVNARRLP